MKTNIKLRVTPEQSEAVQKICFANKIYWNKKFELIFLDSPYLFINDNRLNSTDSTRFYNGNQGEEVDADLFIRTNGTCVESTETIKVCCKEYILTNEEKEYLYNKQPYRLPKLKSYSKISQEPECQFAKYGFEKPDFNGEIFKQIKGGSFIGCVYYSKGDVPVVWNSVGTCSPSNVGHDLKPIKNLGMSI